MKMLDLSSSFEVFERDCRLNSWHISILFSLLILALRQGRLLKVTVNRSKIMSLSHIRTLPTYHKYFKDLQEFGYIHYRPSYHPGVKSEVDICII